MAKVTITKTSVSGQDGTGAERRRSDPTPGTVWQRLAGVESATLRMCLQFFATT